MRRSKANASIGDERFEEQRHADQAQINGPIRTCVGCHTKRAKRDLVRLIVDRSGKIEWDLRQIKPGRGVYLCPADECLAEALKRGRFSRALRRPVQVDSEKLIEVPWKM